MQNKPKVVKRETSNSGRRPTSKVNPTRIPASNNGYQQIGSKSNQVTSKKAEFLNGNAEEEDDKYN